MFTIESLKIKEISSPKRIYINKKLTLADLQKRVEDEFYIPIDNQLIYRECYEGGALYKHINPRCNLEKTLESIEIEDGSILFVEIIDANLEISR